ncbi:MAG: ligase-associated DNA damage response endonuclease PdeM [Taibaiella sp.]|nr:ligase-associated DNA damage response endonuclease PdeM [Taibaiella sp.]
MLDIELKGENLKLLPERAIWWPSESTLIIADLHWGKAGHFRKNGIAIPHSAQPKDELRLAKIIKETNAERLFIAGDLFHSRDNKEVDNFTYWRREHSQLQIDLVIGNHDILPKEKYEGWQMQWHTNSYCIGPFCIAHDEQQDTELYTIHGHIHPAVMINGKGHQAGMKLCCFAQDAKHFILPAFGSFTGSHIIDKNGYQHIYVIAESEVIQWK